MKEIQRSRGFFLSQFCAKQFYRGIKYLSKKRNIQCTVLLLVYLSNLK